jgi:hypothetical protein
VKAKHWWWRDRRSEQEAAGKVPLRTRNVEYISQIGFAAMRHDTGREGSAEVVWLTDLEIMSIRVIR